MLISTLREKMGTLIVVLITICIVSFLLQDAFNSNTGILGSRGNSVGKINGKKINVKEYELALQKNIAGYKLNNPNENMDEVVMQSIREQTWNDLIKENTAGIEYEKMGIQLGDAEIQDMLFGQNPHPQVKASFTNPQTGQFNPEAVKNFLERLGEDDEQVSSEEKTARWNNFMRFVKRERIDGKYTDILKKAVYTPKWMVDFDNTLNTASYSGKVVNVLYSSIPDETIKITDNDLSSYLQSNQAKYKGDAAASIDYVSFSTSPSGADSAFLRNKLNALVDTFAKISDDSMFVTLNSDVPFDTRYLHKSEIKRTYADTLFKYSVGTVLGPIFENGSYELCKIVSKKVIADSVLARHIFLTIDNPKDSSKVKAQADSILAVATDSSSFAALAALYSKDPSNAKRGGSLGWVKQGTTPPDFNKFLFDANNGDKKVIKTSNGYHVVQVVKSEKINEGLKLAFITNELSASNETEKAAYDKAAAFANVTKNSEQFDKNATDQGLQKKSSTSFTKNAINVPGVGTSRELVKWAFENKVNDVSGIISLDNQYVVARVKTQRKEGLPTVADIKEELTQGVMKEKKAENIINKIKDAKTQDINALASALGVTAIDATNITFRSNAIGELQEPLAAAALSGCPQGKISQAIKGTNGVLVVSTVSTTPANAVSDMVQQQRMLSSTLKNKVEFGVYKALEKGANVSDTRDKFY